MCEETKEVQTEKEPTLNEKLEELGYKEETNYDSSNVQFELHENAFGQQVIVLTKGGKEFLFGCLLQNPDGSDSEIEPEICNADVAMLLS